MMLVADLRAPGSVKSVDEQHDDPEKQDQHEFNDGDKSPSNMMNPNLEDSGANGEDDARSDSSAQTGFSENSPGIERLKMVLPLVLHYFQSEESGHNDPILRGLHKKCLKRRTPAIWTAPTTLTLTTSFSNCSSSTSSHTVFTLVSVPAQCLAACPLSPCPIALWRSLRALATGPARTAALPWPRTARAPRAVPRVDRRALASRAPSSTKAAVPPRLAVSHYPRCILLHGSHGRRLRHNARLRRAAAVTDRYPEPRPPGRRYLPGLRRPHSTWWYLHLVSEQRTDSTDAWLGEPCRSGCHDDGWPHGRPWWSSAPRR